MFVISDFDSFICGFAYGTTTVIVGQPLDTIKTRMQAKGTGSSMVTTAVSIFQREGVAGLYRGGMSLVVGGALMRSAQFGVYDAVLLMLRKQHSSYNDQPIDKILGIFDPHVIVAGFAGGISRGIVEGPFEYIKVRRQVEQPWLFKEIMTGSGATIFRNAFLFGSFVTYMDLSKQIVPGGLSPFMTGAVCSNLAWLTIWPLDVVKSQLQSGNYAGKSIFVLLKDVYKSGLIYRGLLPGLARSTIANGCSMVAYKKVQQLLIDSREIKEQ